MVCHVLKLIHISDSSEVIPHYRYKKMITKLLKNGCYLLTLAAAPGSLLAVTPPPVSVPDTGSTVVLAGIALAGLCTARRFLSKRG